MNKDIIYIDVEDDVTSVIGKVRASEQKIVALVPPKTIGTLQSAVNLRLLQKAADSAGKRIVLITNNSGLTALAAGVKIPVARNLQSKPEIPAAPEKAQAEDEDVIKGEELPVGELAAATGAAAAAEALAPAAALKPADDDIVVDSLPDLDSAVPAAAATAVAKKKAGPRVPNFGRFRKWIFIGGGLLVALIVLLVLANTLWTGASVVIAAQSSDEPIDLPLTLTTSGPTNVNTDVIQAVAKTTKTTQSASFTPTGQKNTGNKATGTVKFSTNDADVVLSGTTIPAGSALTTADGTVFTTDSSVTFTPSNYKNAPVSVTAQSPGAAANGKTGPVSGAPDGVSATLTSATSGGTDNIVTVVTADDVAKAKSALGTSDATAAKAQLTSQFGSDYVVIGDSFNAQAGDPASTPAVGQPATTAKLSQDTTYTLLAIPKSQIKIVDLNYLNSQISGDNQKIYDDGSSKARVSQFVTSPSGVQTLHVLATGKIGPNIDENALKSQLVGKKVAEITAQIKAINGVKDVTVTLSPFWRTTAPSADKIKVSFDLNGNGN